MATFTDADPNADGSSDAATIDWGDGTSSAGVVADSSGVFTVSGTHTYTTTGTFGATATIQDVDSTATATGSVIVSTVTATAESATASNGISSDVTLATFTDAGPGPDTAVIDWGDGTLTSTGEIDGSSGNYTVSGSHTYAQVGDYVATVTITTAGGETSVVAAPVAATDGPLSAMGTSISEAQGVDSGSVVVATFTAADPNATAADFGATIDWGDGSDPSLFNTITQSGDTFSVIGDYTYLDQGTYTVAVTITDGGGATATATSTATVGPGPINATPVTINATEGIDSGGVPVATFTGDANAATIDWGDGSTPTTGTVANGVVTGDHTYAEAGSYTVNVTLTDVNGYTTTAASTANVADAPLTAGDVSLTGFTEGQSFSGTVASFSDANPNAGAADFTASIDWGDGEVTDGTVSGGDGAFTVSSDKTYYATGSFPVVVTVTDTDGTSVIVSGTATVADAALTGSAANLDYPTAYDLLNGVTVAQFNDPYTGGQASDYSATIDWGDGTTTTGVVRGSDGSYSVTGSHTYVTPMIYTVTVTVSDAGGGATFYGTADVLPQPTYGLVNFSATPYTVSASDFTASVDWGDQTAPTPGYVSGGPSEFHISAPHPYAEEGTYTVMVTLSYQGAVVAVFGTTATVVAAPMLGGAPAGAGRGADGAGRTGGLHDAGRTAGTRDQRRRDKDVRSRMGPRRRGPVSTCFRERNVDGVAGSAILCLPQPGRHGRPDSGGHGDGRRRPQGHDLHHRPHPERSERTERPHRRADLRQPALQRRHGRADVDPLADRDAERPDDRRRDDHQPAVRTVAGGVRRPGRHAQAAVRDRAGDRLPLQRRQPR